jgi:hypothetical protein
MKCITKLKGKMEKWRKPMAIGEFVAVSFINELHTGPFQIYEEWVWTHSILAILGKDIGEDDW